MKLKLVITTLGAGLYVLAGHVAAPMNAAETCQWRGTAFLCDGECEPGERLALEAKRDKNLDLLLPSGANVVNAFGEECTTGTKALCCKTEAAAPAAPPPLSTPNPQFCNWYASEAVARSAQGAKCGFSGARWDPNKQFHYDWCMQQKSSSRDGRSTTRAWDSLRIARRKKRPLHPSPIQTLGKALGLPSSLYRRMSMSIKNRLALVSRSASSRVEAGPSCMRLAPTNGASWPEMMCLGIAVGCGVAKTSN